MGLNSLGGADAPPELAAQIHLVASLPNGALADLWTLLEPNLGPAVAPSAQAVAYAFCAAHGVTEDELIPVVRGCRDLFRSAAGLDVGVEPFARDLDVLLHGHDEVARALVGCYSKALTGIRTLNVMALMSEYGAVADDVRIRMDYVQTSKHTPESMVPIAIMSLRYRNDDKEQHLAVQMPLPVVAKLKAMCDAVVEAAGK